MDVFRTPDERFEGLPGYDFEPNYAEVDGLRLHYVDEGEGRPIVCFHGEPDLGLPLPQDAAPLRDAGNRVVCPDYPGFGRSDKPTDLGWYSYDRHCEWSPGCSAGLTSATPSSSVQDWGGPIGLRWAVENADRVGALVILNTGVFTGRVSKGFMAWRDFAEKNPDLPVGVVMQGATATELPDEVVAAYEAPFPTAESKAGAAMFPLLVPTSEDDPGAKEMREVADALGRWEKPALLAFSDTDPVFPYPKAGDRFIEMIPAATEQVQDRGRGPLPAGGSRRTDRRAHAELPGGEWRLAAGARGPPPRSAPRRNRRRGAGPRRRDRLPAARS